jgi:hypothetical protein
MQNPRFSKGRIAHDHWHSATVTTLCSTTPSYTTLNLPPFYNRKANRDRHAWSIGDNDASTRTILFITVLGQFVSSKMLPNRQTCFWTDSPANQLYSRDPYQQRSVWLMRNQSTTAPRLFRATQVQGFSSLA